MISYRHTTNDDIPANDPFAKQGVSLTMIPSAGTSLRSLVKTQAHSDTTNEY